MSWETVKYKGIEYRSLFALCKHFKKNYQKTLERIARGYSIESAIEVDDLRSCPVKNYFPTNHMYSHTKEISELFDSIYQQSYSKNERCHIISCIWKYQHGNTHHNDHYSDYDILYPIDFTHPQSLISLVF